MKRILTLVLFVVSSITIMHAQRVVSGTITDSDGETLIGASVLVENTSVGTTTDIDGKYSLKVPEGATNLVVSYTGFPDQKIAIGVSDIIDATLTAGVLLDEVVVTSFGLERNARDVTYANQTVKAEDLLSSPNKNTLEALRGKTAGVKISTASGSVGASTRIVLRGESSLTGNNNALIVVDGIPIDNSTSSGGEGSASSGFADYGNRFSDINPDDIASVTVLKGASATSIYGSRGSAGVLLITTKSGAENKDGKMKIGFNSSTSFERAYVLLQRQDQYGQGYGLPFASEPHRDSGENWSWGPAFDGVVRPWTSPVDVDGDGELEYLSRPYSAVPNQLENFFRTGRTLSNSVNLSGSKGMFTYYASYSNTRQEGILENTDYTRNTFKLSSSAKFTDKLSSNFSVSYANVGTNTAQEGSRPFEGQNAYANAIQAPVNIPYNELRDYTNPYHSFKGYYGSYTVNPYFVLNEHVNNSGVNNMLGSFSTTYKILDDLSVTAKLGTNIVSNKIRQAKPKYQYEDHYVWEDGLTIGSRGGRDGSPGFYSETESVNTNIDFTVSASYSRKLTENGDFVLDITPGFNLFNTNSRWISGETVGGLVVPEWYHLDNNVEGTRSSQYNAKQRILGAYGQARIGYQNKLFLDYSARNDWSSTLPEENSSFFYQSVGLAAVVTDFFEAKPEFLDFLKFRASFGTTGKDAPRYSLYSTFIGNPDLQSLANEHTLFFPLNGQPGFTQSNLIGNNELKPELTTTFEFGLDGGLFNNRVEFAYTYYNANHQDQIVQVALPSSTGFTSTFKNLGKMTNKGHELSLTLRPITGLVKDLTWDIDLIFAKNTNEVVEIIDPATPDEELPLGTFGGVSILAKEGLPYGTFSGPDLLYNDAGQQVVDASGLPRQTPGNVDYGSYQPDFTASIGSTVGFKGVSFNFLFDIKQGGEFLSYTKDLTEFNGTGLTTIEGGRDAFVVANSVVEQADGSFVDNTVETNRYDFLRVMPFSTHLIDASFVKLREIGLRYAIPERLVKDLPISRVSVGFFAKNVKFWLPAENTWADPEVNGPALTGNAQGIETTQTPPAKSFGFNLSLQF